MGSLNKLPPDVAKELLRHVAPRPLKSAAATATSNPQAAAKLFQQQQRQQYERPGTGWIFAGCMIFTGTAFAIPFVAQHWIGNLNARDEPLTHAQIRRGAFMNSGSTDAGKDPAWDFRKGLYRKDDNYWAIFDGERNANTDTARQAFGGMAVLGAGGEETAKKLRERNESTKKKAEEASSK